ncbi:MAG: DUF268 domain-containing protein [Parachlamydia sp.]|nr:DUF268 domain-containing protein [Parachlamydia sp.]
MIHILTCLLALSPLAMLAAPPSEIPQELWKAFTLNNQIPVTYWFADDSLQTAQSEKLEFFISKAKNREWCYNGEVDGFIFQALDDIAQEIKGKEIALTGSLVNWYASILLSYDAKPVVIDFLPAVTKETKVTYLTREEFAQNPRKFDLIITVSGLAHEGLGRQGEPLHPDGDLWMMSQFKQLLNPGGKVLIAVPVGPDALVWNAFRVYGEKRLRLLLKGWKPVRYYGFRREFLHRNPGYLYQPALLLTPR